MLEFISLQLSTRPAVLSTGFQSGHLTWALALITHSSSEEGGDKKVKRSAWGCSDLQPCMKWQGWGSAPLRLGEWLSANEQKYWIQVAKMNFLRRVAEFSLRERVRKYLSSGTRTLWCPPRGVGWKWLGRGVSAPPRSAYYLHDLDAGMCRFHIRHMSHFTVDLVKKIQKEWTWFLSQHSTGETSSSVVWTGRLYSTWSPCGYWQCFVSYLTEW